MVQIRGMRGVGQEAGPLIALVGLFPEASGRVQRIPASFCSGLTSQTSPSISPTSPSSSGRVKSEAEKFP